MKNSIFESVVPVDKVVVSVNSEEKRATDELDHGPAAGDNAEDIYIPGETRLTYWNVRKYEKLTGRNLRKFKLHFW